MLMTMYNIGMTIPHVGDRHPATNDNLEIRRGSPSDEVLAERLTFVKAMRWFPDDFDDDRDRYDTHLGTYHFTKYSVDQTGERSVIATMRLTNVEDIEGSLSYAMLADNPGFQDAVRERQNSVEDGKVWDLTRLVFSMDGKQSTESITESMVELFGMAVEASTGREYEADKVYWIFTTTPWIKKFLDANGIQNEVLAQGMLPNSDDDEENTLFCKVDVYGAVESLRTSDSHQDVYGWLVKGIEEAKRSYV